MQSVLQQFHVQKSLFDQDRTNAAQEKLRQLRQRQIERQKAEELAAKIREENERQADMLLSNVENSRESSQSRLRRQNSSKLKAKGSTSVARIKNSKQSKKDRDIDAAYLSNNKNLISQNNSKKSKMLVSPNNQSKNQKLRASSTNHSKPGSKGSKTAQSIRDPAQNFVQHTPQNELIDANYNRQYQRKIKVSQKDGSKKNLRQSYDSDAYTEIDQNSPEIRTKKKIQKQQNAIKALGMSSEVTASNTGNRRLNDETAIRRQSGISMESYTQFDETHSPRQKEFLGSNSFCRGTMMNEEFEQIISGQKLINQNHQPKVMSFQKHGSIFQVQQPDKTDIRNFDIVSDDEEDHQYARTQNFHQHPDLDSKRQQDHLILQSLLSKKGNTFESPVKRAQIKNEDQFRSELDNNSMLMNPMLVDSQRNSSMQIRAQQNQNMMNISRMGNQNHSTVFQQSAGMNLSNDYQNIQISFTEKKTNKGASLLSNETPPVSAYGGSHKANSIFKREDGPRDEFSVEAKKINGKNINNRNNNNKKSVFDQKSQLKNQIKIFKRLQKHQQEQQQDNSRKKAGQSALTKNQKLSAQRAAKIKTNSPYGQLQQYNNNLDVNIPSYEGAQSKMGMAVNGQSVIQIVKNTNAPSQDSPSFNDVQVNYLRSPEKRGEFGQGSMNTMSVEAKANNKKILNTNVQEEQCEYQYPRMSNFLTSPKQDKSFTALPVIVSQKTRNNNEVTQTNEKMIQREFSQVKGGCPNIVSNINQNIFQSELHDPFSNHRPSLTQTTLDARKNMGDMILGPSMSSLTINSELKNEIDAFQNQHFSRLPNGDCVIYDSQCKMMTFKHKSKTPVEMMTYQNLDFQEFKKQMDSFKFNPIVGCNDVKQKDNAGKLMYKQAENNEILDLDNTQKLRYDTKLIAKDKERAQEIKSQYQKLKKIQEFDKLLYVPMRFQEGQHVLFYARFESGNLHRVIQRQQKALQTFSGLEIPEDEIEDIGFEFEYDLYLEYDTNSEGLMHWFYFQVLTKGLVRGTRVKLNIRNLHRTRSLFEGGMLPRIYYEDQKGLEQGKKGWHVDPKVTYGLQFFQTNQQENFDPECFKAEKRYHTLSLIYEVQEQNESIYIAYDRPYTYSQNLKKFMDGIRNEPKFSNYLQCATLCKSLGGNDIQLLTITENVKLGFNYYDQLRILKKDFRDRYAVKNDMERMHDKQNKINQKLKRYAEDPEEVEQQDQNMGIDSRYGQHLLFNSHKKAIIITARVHPGETQSSFALEGMVNFILSDHQKAKEIRKQMIVYVVPMLNPDGVIQGNHRTDLNGMDMNRRWSSPSPWIHPTIYAVKNLTYLIKEERNIDVFCDIHGHFQAHGGFMYCCSYDKEKGNGVPKPDYEKDSMLRVIPQLLSEKNEFFSFRYSTFNMESYKSGSARQAMFNDFKIINSFTLENSFFARYTEQEIEKINKIMQQNIEQTSEQRKLGANMMEGLKPINGSIPACEQDSDPEEDEKISVCSTVQRQLDSMKTYNENQNKPSYVYESVQGCHHFSSSDHEKLGSDLCEVFNKVFVKSENYAKDQEEVKAIIAKYMRRFQKGDKAAEMINSMSPQKNMIGRPNINFKNDVAKNGSIVASSYKQINDNSQVDMRSKVNEYSMQQPSQNLKTQSSLNKFSSGKQPQRTAINSSPNKKLR